MEKLQFFKKIFLYVVNYKYKGVFMTYTTKVKEEISHIDIDTIEAMAEISSFIRFDGEVTKNNITLTILEGAVATRIYKLMRICFDVKAHVTLRIQKRFHIKQIYILEYNNNVSDILEKLNIYKDGKKTLPEEYFLETKEEKASFLRGLFLATGSINNPKTSGYHLEFNVKTKKEAKFVVKLLKYFNTTSKILKRQNKYMIYIKQAEMISDLLKLFGAINSMFFYEDVRIYRDHKNMVNRLNNCEIANQEKTTITGLKQLNDIKYLEDNNLTIILDDKTNFILKYRKMYPESSYQELADIITTETGIKVTKSIVNHTFRKVKNIINNKINS